MKDKKTDNSFALIIFLFLFIFIIEFYGFAWARTQHRSTGYKIMQQAAEHKQLMAQQKNLKIEVAVLKSPQRIGKIAKKRMGLSTPGQNQILTIR